MKKTHAPKLRALLRLTKWRIRRRRAETWDRLLNARYLLGLQVSTRELGIIGEREVARRLKKSGYFVWFTNWRCKVGELDLIVYRGHEVRIIEVKARTTGSAPIFSGFEAVDRHKARQLTKTWHCFQSDFRRELKARRLWEVRFQIIAVTFDTQCRKAISFSTTDLDFQLEP